MTGISPISTHILLVDDDRLVLATLSRGLQNAGYQVSAADSAEEAEHLLAAGGRPDLAILDVRMPGSSGVQLAQRLRLLDHVPFMMLSAYSDASTVQQASESGALSFLTKPIDISRLVPAVIAALARADELHELDSERKQLQSALAGQRDINVAIGIVMAQRLLTRDAAFALLREAARAQRRKLALVAADVIAAHERPEKEKPE